MSGIVPVSLSVSPYLRENIGAKYCKLNCKSIAYQGLALISLVAVAAIMGGIFAIAYTKTVLSGNTAFMVLAAVISASPLATFAAYAKKRGDELGELAQLEQKIIVQMEKMKRWPSPQIEQYLQTQCYGAPPTHPPQGLIPLIARYHVLREKAETLLREANNELLNKDTNRELRYNRSKDGWHRLEQMALPALLDAAIVLQIIREPTLQLQVDPSHRSSLYPGLGELYLKKHARRLHDRVFGPKNDYYFVFPKKLQRPPLTFEELRQEPTPEAVRKKLFLR